MFLRWLGLFHCYSLYFKRTKHLRFKYKCSQFALIEEEVTQLELGQVILIPFERDQLFKIIIEDVGDNQTMKLQVLLDYKSHKVKETCLRVIDMELHRGVTEGY